MIIKVQAWCRDCFNLEADGFEYEGYVPSGLGFGGGDAFNISIDVETGQILNWKSDKVKDWIVNEFKEIDD